MNSLRSKVKSLLDLIENPTQMLTPVGLSIYEDGTRYEWSRTDFDYMKSFVEKNTRVHLQHLYVDLKKIYVEGTYNTWMTDTIGAAIKNVGSLKDSIHTGIQSRYYRSSQMDTSTAELVDKAKINIEVPASVHLESWESLHEVLDYIYDELERLIPE
jgi:hypothetical protein